jgi:hypothetical protein
MFLVSPSPSVRVCLLLKFDLTDNIFMQLGPHYVREVILLKVRWAYFAIREPQEENRIIRTPLWIIFIVFLLKMGLLV